MPEAYRLTAADRRVPGLTVLEFLAALKYSRSIAVEFPSPEAPQVRLRWVASATAANAVLRASDRPLTLKEISARIAKEFGAPGQGVVSRIVAADAYQEFFSGLDLPCLACGNT